MTNEEAREAWKKLYSEIDKDNWLFVGTINPEMVALAIKALEERPQGEWKFVFDDKVNNRFIYKCSECGREVSVYSSDALIPVYPFCHCGAKMLKGGAE